MVSGIGSASSPGDAQAPGNRSKIHQTATDFEGLMIGEMMKAARASSDGGWLGEDADDASSSAMDMAEEFFARGMAKAGGLGIAHMVERSLK